MATSHQPMCDDELNHEMHIPILDSIDINLDEEDTLDDDEHEIIDLDVDLPNMLSMQLTFTSTSKHYDSLEGPLDLAIIPTTLDISPLARYPPSFNTNG